MVTRHLPLAPRIMNKCPFNHETLTFDPLDLNDPYPALAWAREEQPVFYSPEIDYWVVTRFDDVKAIFRDHDTYTAANTITPITPFSDGVQQRLKDGNYTPVPVLSNNVPPDHTRVRKLVNKLFLPRRMRHFEPNIREMVRERLATFIDQGEAEIVETLTYDFPAQVLFLVLGVPPEDVPQVKEWSDNRIELYYGRPSAEEQLERTKGLVPFWHFVVDLVNRKIENPTDDLTSDLIKMRNGDDSILTVNEIASCMITLLVAGHETTTAQITNGLLHWLTDREKWEELVEHPDRIPNAVEEMMRFDPSVCTWRRWSVKETVVGGVTIPAESNILLMLNSANRDSNVFPDPDNIDVGRDNLKEHLAFGYGIHYCVGAPLARLEMTILFEEMAKAMPSLRLLPNQSLNYTRNISFRGPLQLQVAWDEH